MLKVSFHPSSHIQASSFKSICAGWQSHHPWAELSPLISAVSSTSGTHNKPELKQLRANTRALKAHQVNAHSLIHSWQNCHLPVIAITSHNNQTSLHGLRLFCTRWVLQKSDVLQRCSNLYQLPAKNIVPPQKGSLKGTHSQQLFPKMAKDISYCREKHKDPKFAGHG